MNVTDAIATTLAEEGVEFLFGFPSNPLLDSGAATDAGIRTIVTRQERTAVHMADAIGRLTSGNRLAAFCCQRGPGAENAFGGVAQAYGESAPLVAIPAGYPRAKAAVDPKFSSFVSYDAVSKSCEQLTDPAAVGETMRRAFSAARNGRPRPAVVELPQDVHDAELPTEFSYKPATTSRPAPDPDGVARVADAILAADRPVLFAGQGIHYAEAWEPLRQLAESRSIPVATSLNGKSAFPEDHHLSLGAASQSEPGHLAHFIREADLLLGVGCSFTDTAYGLSVPNDPTIVHSTIDPTDVDKDVEADHALLGDAKLVLEALLDEFDARSNLPPRDDDAVAEEIHDVRQSWLDEWHPKLTSDETPINPYRVVHELCETLDPTETIITHDAGNARDFLAPFWTATEPLSYVGWGKTTQLGYGLGLAMGAKLLHPQKTCVNVWGDGAFGMTGLDLETAVRENIPVLSVLLNNYAMAGYDTPFGGDFATVADGLGAYSERVEHPDDVADAIQRGVERTNAGTPALLEFVTAEENILSRPDLR